MCRRPDSYFSTGRKTGALKTLNIPRFYCDVFSLACQTAPLVIFSDFPKTVRTCPPELSCVPVFWPTRILNNHISQAWRPRFLSSRYHRQCLPQKSLVVTAIDSTKDDGDLCWLLRGTLTWMTDLADGRKRRGVQITETLTVGIDLMREH